MAITATPLTQEQALARWETLTTRDWLPDDANQYEMDEFGTLLVNPPPQIRHQRVSMWIRDQLQAQLGGEAIAECPVYAGGVFVADVAWMPVALADASSAAVVAPPLVVEVASPSNSRRDLRDKISAYLQHGVQEVVLVDLTGGIHYHGPDGERESSAFGITLTAQLPGPAS